MDVRRIRPLVPPPYPRRNQYTPLYRRRKLHSRRFRESACGYSQKLCIVPLRLLLPVETLRWFRPEFWERFFANCTHSVSTASLRLPVKTVLAPLRLLFKPQTLRWFAV